MHIAKGLALLTALLPSLASAQMNLRYVMNYSATLQRTALPGGGTELLTGAKVAAGQSIDLAPWGVAILESGAARSRR